MADRYSGATVRQRAARQRDYAVLARLGNVGSSAYEGGRHSVPVLALSFAHGALGGNLLASAGEAGTVVLADTRFPGHPQKLATLRPHEPHSAYDVSWSPDDTRVLTAGSDRLCVLTDVCTGVAVGRFADPGNHSAVKAARFMPASGGALFAAASRRGSAAVYDVRAGGGSGAPVAVAAATAADGGSALPLPPLGAVDYAHFARGGPAPALRRPGQSAAPGVAEAGISALAWADRFLLTGGVTDGCVKVWDVRRLTNSAATTSGSGGRGRSAATAVTLPSSSSSSSGADDAVGAVHPAAESGAGAGCVFVLHQPVSSGRSYGVTSLEVSPDGASLLVAYTSSRILTFDVARLLHGGGGAAGAEKGAFLPPPPPLVAAHSGADVDGGAGAAAAARVSAPPRAAGTKRSRAAPGAPSSPSSSAAAAALQPSSPDRRRREERLREYVTPQRRSVRASLAWQGVDAASPDGRAIASAPAHDASHLAFDEYGGHDGSSFYVRARWSRCGRYITSGSREKRGYVWAADPGVRRLWTSRRVWRQDVLDSMFGGIDGDDSDSDNASDGENDSGGGRRSFSGAFAPSHYPPILVLDDAVDNPCDINDVAWGGLPAGYGVDGAARWPPMERARIATGDDGGVVAVWAPLAWELPRGAASADLAAWGRCFAPAGAAHRELEWPPRGGVASLSGGSSRPWTAPGALVVAPELPDDGNGMSSSTSSSSRTPSEFAVAAAAVAAGRARRHAAYHDDTVDSNEDEWRRRLGLGRECDECRDPRLGFSAQQGSHFDTDDEDLYKGNGVQDPYDGPPGFDWDVQWASPYALGAGLLRRERRDRRAQRRLKREAAGVAQRDGAVARAAPRASGAGAAGDDSDSNSTSSDDVTMGPPAYRRRLVSALHAPAQELLSRALARQLAQPAGGGSVDSGAHAAATPVSQAAAAAGELPPSAAVTSAGGAAAHASQASSQASTADAGGSGLLSAAVTPPPRVQRVVHAGQLALAAPSAQTQVGGGGAALSQLSPRDGGGGGEDGGGTAPQPQVQQLLTPLAQPAAGVAAKPSADTAAFVADGSPLLLDVLLDLPPSRLPPPPRPSPAQPSTAAKAAAPAASPAGLPPSRQTPSSPASSTGAPVGGGAGSPGPKLQVKPKLAGGEGAAGGRRSGKKGGAAPAVTGSSSLLLGWLQQPRQR